MSKEEQIEILEELIDVVKRMGKYTSGWDNTVSLLNNYLEKIKSLE